MRSQFSCYYKWFPMAFVKQLILMKHFRHRLLFRCHHCYVLRLNFKSKTSFSFCLRQRRVFSFIMTLILDFERKFFDTNQKKEKNGAIFHPWGIKANDLQNIVYYILLKLSGLKLLLMLVKLTISVKCKNQHL